MVQITDFLLAIIPMLVVFVGLVFFRKGGTLMGVIGLLLTIIIAIVFFNTPWDLTIYASVYGILASFAISLMVLFTILQVTMMDVTGAIRSITGFIKTIAAERYEQIMLINVGLGTFLVAIGATPVTMLPPIMIALGFSPVAAIALPCLGYDPITSFSLLAVPITQPASLFHLNLGWLASNVAWFLPVTATGLSLAMLWIADGMNGLKKGFVPAIVTGLTLGISSIILVHILPESMIILTGVFAGMLAIIALLLLRVIQGKPIFVKKDTGIKEDVAADGAAVMPLWRAVFPWALLVGICLLLGLSEVQTFLYNLLGDAQKIHVVANQTRDLALLKQAYPWVLVSTIISFPILVRSKAEASKIIRLWMKRAWSPTVAAAVFFAIAYVMDWSARSVVVNASGVQVLSAAPEANMNLVIGLTLATYLGAWIFPLVSPLLGLFGGFVSGSETSSNVMFKGILNSATDKLDLDFMKVYAGHAVAGGVASGIAVAKIVNAAAVIDQIGLEGEVIRKSAAVVFVLTVLVGIMLAAWIFVWPALV
ncbi:MAG TPA: L-lactate permease [Methanocella sp.]